LIRVRSRADTCSILIGPYPFRLDSDSRPSDLKFYGRPRSIRTPSFKWFYQIYWILIERPGSKVRELTGLKLGFRPSSPARRAEGGRRRRYSDFWTTASSRQDAGGGGELGCDGEVIPLWLRRGSGVKVELRVGGGR
jgi:hypothetical protein